LTDDKISIANYRLERANELLNLADKLIQDDILTSANRLYYAVFNIMRSVLALNCIDFKKHSGVIAYFRENYLKANIFDKKYSNLIGKTEYIRNKSDYEDFFVIKKSEVTIYLTEAKEFHKEVSKYIEKYIAELKS